MPVAPPVATASLGRGGGGGGGGGLWGGRGAGQKRASLDELLSQDRARIAAAAERNADYLADKAAASTGGASGAYAAAKRQCGGTGAGGVDACSVYVTGLPRDVALAELEAHFGQVWGG